MALDSLPETYKKVTEVKGISPPWKNMSIHWQRQFVHLIHEIPKVDGRDLSCVEADCLTRLHTSTRGREQGREACSVIHLCH